MEKLLARLLYYLKYLFLVVAFVLVFYGILVTYQRLEKSLSLAFPVFLPFVVVLIIYIMNLFMKKDTIRDNILYNFTAILAFTGIIVVCLRSAFDDNMVMFAKYGIRYNPLFLSDNLSSIQILLYVLASCDILLVVSGLFEEKKVVDNTLVKKKDLFEKAEDEDKDDDYIMEKSKNSKDEENFDDTLDV